MKLLDNSSRAFYLQNFGGAAPEATAPKVLLTSSGDLPKLQFLRGSALYGSLGFDSGSSVISLRNEQNSNMEFWTAGARRWYIDSSGNLIPGANYGYDIGLCGTRPRHLYLSGIVTSNNDTNLDGPNFVADTITKGTNIMAYDVRRSGTSVAGFSTVGYITGTGLTVSGPSALNGAVCSSSTFNGAGFFSSGVVTVAGNAGLAAGYGANIALAAGFGGGNSGRLLIGDGSNWKFYISQKHGPLLSDITDLFSFTDFGFFGIGTTAPGNLLTVNSPAGTVASQVRVQGNGTGALSLLCAGTNNSAVGFDADVGPSGWIARDTSAAVLYKAGGSFQIHGNTGLTVGTLFNTTQLLNLNLSNGNLGVGASSPMQKLQVDGTIGIGPQGGTAWPLLARDSSNGGFIIQDYLSTGPSTTNLWKMDRIGNVSMVGTLGTSICSGNFSGQRGLNLLNSTNATSYTTPLPSPGIYLSGSFYNGSTATAKYVALQVQGLCSSGTNPYGLAIGSTDTNAVAWFDAGGGLSVGSVPTTNMPAGTINAASGYTINNVAAPFVPVGGIIAWARDIVSGHSIGLPAGFIECNGGTTTMVFDGVTYTNVPVPTLNGISADGSDRLFLRGCRLTPGGTGGQVSHAHTVNFVVTNIPQGSLSSISAVATVTSPTVATAVVPPFYEVVYIMRVK